MPPQDGSPRKGQTISARRSTSSLRPDPSDNGGPPRVSLAHELAAAMMPEPTLTSQMLAEEFGIEFDDGAEGTEGGDVGDQDAFAVEQPDDPYYGNGIHESRSLGDEWGISENMDVRHSTGMSSKPSTKGNLADEFDDTFGSSSSFQETPQPSQPPLQLLAENLQATDLFIEQLRRVDAEPTASSSHEPQLENSAAGFIGRLNDVVRQRESQVRTLQEYEREFKKIASEVDGNDVLGVLDELDHVDDLVDKSEKTKDSKLDEDTFRTPTAFRIRAPASELETPALRQQARRMAQLEDEDLSNEQALLGGNEYDEDAYDYDIPSPGKFRKGNDLPPVPPNADIPSPASTLPHLSYLRTVTQSLAQSLTSLSEHAQVNGVNTADAGRKLRALKNKVVELKADWDSADRSRSKIERWEAGLIDDLTTTDASEDSSPELSFSAPSSRDTSPGPDTPELASAPHLGSRRVDGRKLVEEQLRGFRLALAEAALKTEKIMATRN